MTLEEQRTAIAAVIRGVYPHEVHEVPADGKVAPPCVIIGRPEIQFLVNSSLGTVSWPITLFETRTDKGAAQTRLEGHLQKILFELRKGAGVNLVLQSATPPPETELGGIEVPAYQINATTTLPNC
jgi:hypothetical protein